MTNTCVLKGISFFDLDVSADIL